MNKEELQGMSDDELNKLSAVKVMNFAFRGYCEEIPEHPYVSPDPNGKLVLYTSDDYTNWNPANDMNDALLLMDQFRYADLKKNHSGGWIAVIGSIAEYGTSAPRAITIAVILAKEV